MEYSYGHDIHYLLEGIMDDVCLLGLSYTLKYIMASVSQYHCDKCGKEFPSLAELDYHKISKHTGQLSNS